MSIAHVEGATPAASSKRRDTDGSGWNQLTASDVFVAYTFSQCALRSIGFSVPFVYAPVARFGPAPLVVGRPQAAVGGA